MSNSTDSNNNPTKTEYDRQSYLDYLVNRDNHLCHLVEAHGMQKCCQLTGWSKPTVIAAVKKYRPDLLSRSPMVLKVAE